MMDGAGEEQVEAREVGLCERPHHALPPAQGTSPDLTFEANEKQMEEWDRLEVETASATWHPRQARSYCERPRAGQGFAAGLRVSVQVYYSLDLPAQEGGSYSKMGSNISSFGERRSLGSWSRSHP
ncbi:hypothetical protein P7K49_009295 [Saguinus oedipus]|uniref:Uncharacterized protein n=1 Tax=Saguinus oedipus TaxID=9490 RepID=A0ABQ9VJK6_SAGOE|nr:hypothetical protein P7K49_009295 [Saguinus oedipus]